MPFFHDRTSGSLRVVVLQHVAFEEPAAIATWFTERGHRVAINRRWLDDELPDPASIDVLVAMGGPMSANDASRYRWIEPEILLIRNAVDSGVPTLGICLGAQLIARALGAAVRTAPQKEIGWWPVEFDAREAAPEWSHFASSLPARATVLHWHGETFDLPSGAARVASSPACENQGFVFGSNVVALQFHLESTKESIMNLARMSGDDIEYGTYQVRRARAEATLRSGEIRYGGGSRAILSGLLEYLERSALDRGVAEAGVPMKHNRSRL